MAKAVDTLERLFAKCIPEPNSGCWIWMASLTNGYANTCFTKEAAYRAAYKAAKGNIPKNREIHHRCFMRCCINPDHLELVTHAQNIALSPTTQPNLKRAKTHCIHGHEFTEENTNRYATMHYTRQCKTCSRIRALKRAARLRAQKRR